jgi:hypothetical protein
LAYFLGTSIKLDKEEMGMAYISAKFSKEVTSWANMALPQNILRPHEKMLMETQKSLVQKF